LAQHPESESAEKGTIPADRFGALVGLLLATVLVVLDGTIANVASSVIFRLVNGAEAPRVGLIVAAGMAVLGALFSIARMRLAGRVPER
jgi:DHA2 family multidrug resistance protein-like MFS transporter